MTTKQAAREAINAIADADFVRAIAITYANMSENETHRKAYHRLCNIQSGRTKDIDLSARKIIRLLQDELIETT